jgi:hypothetical protein
MSASISITDAVAITGATSGKAITEKEVTTPALTTAQITALVSFIGTLGTWPGGPNNVLALSIFRSSANPALIFATVRGLIVYASGTAAQAGMNARTDEYVGTVP